MSSSFLPSLPLQFSYPLLFAVLLVAGMLGGEMARAARLPRIVGYVVVGMVFAPLGDAMSFVPLLDAARIFGTWPWAWCSSTWAGAWTCSG